MARHLEYKGWQSTRVVLGILAALGVTAAYIWADVTAEQWLNFLLNDLGMYAASEVGAKGAYAYYARQNAEEDLRG